MSEEFQKLDIAKLTNDAEHGKGCALSTAITDLGFEERFKALKAIEALNAKHRIDEASIPQLFAAGSSDQNRYFANNALLDMTVATKSFPYRATMYHDELDPSKGTHTPTCTDLIMPPKQ